jgi:hypothetical protein
MKTALIVWSAVLLAAIPRVSKPVAMSPERFPRLATVDDRYQSYNVEMAEITGGAFWKPYGKESAAAERPRAGIALAASAESSGADFYARLKTEMPPIDLSNANLRKLAAALGPVYVRASGNAADSVYFHDAEDAPPKAPPKGFGSVLTRQQWKGLVDFARAVDGKIVTSFAVAGGTRDANGRWTPEQARKFISYTKSLGGDIAAAEFFNEPTLGPQGIGGLPPDYSAADFARDFAVFRPFAKTIAPNMLILGPSATGEGPVTLLSGKLIKTEDLFTATPRPIFDAFSYHAYSASSIRCKAPGKLTTTKEAALSEEWLGRTEQTFLYYAALRDRFMPGKPIWITETSESSCGGDPWAKTFLDSFRYLDQLGRLARHGVATVMHNTLAVSEYSLIDRPTMKPRPNYWAALLWRRLMGSTVLDAGASSEGFHVYAQCLPGQRGGVTVLAINTSRSVPRSLNLPFAAERYTLSARNVDDTSVQLNGKQLATQGNGDLPELQGQRIPAGDVGLAPLTITFLAIPTAANPSCK